MDVKPLYPDGTDPSDTNITNRDSTALHSGTKSASTEPSSVLESNGPAVEVEKASQPDQNTRPNGGWKAWLQVACGFFIYFNTYGLINTFGIYQDYYTTEFGFNPSRASLIGGIQTFLLFFASGGAGPLYDAGYTQFLVIAGSFFIVLGTMMQSLCTQYWQFILAQSLCVGLGGGLISFLTPAVLSTYFTSLYPLTVGLAGSGTGIGGIILPIIFRQLQPKIGFPWTVRVIGFILLITLLLPAFFLQPRMTPSGGRRKILDTTAFTDWPFVILLIGNFVYLLGGFTPFFYVEIYSVENNIADANLSFYIIAIMNAMSALGRVLPNFLSPYTGPFNMLIISSVLTFIFAFAFEGAHSLASLIIISMGFGGATGLFFALQPVVVVGLCPNPRLIGTRVGMAFCFLSFAVLASNPIAGAIQPVGGYSGVWIWTGVTTAIGTALMFTARLVKADGVLLKKL